MKRRAIGIDDLKRLTQDLLKSGADIAEINTVRKHVSVLKGGGLARLVHPARVLVLLLSDVVGDAPSSIASGPAAPISKSARRWGMGCLIRITAPSVPKGPIGMGMNMGSVAAMP